MRGLYSLFFLLLLVAIAWVGASLAGWNYLFGVIIPLIAIVVFIVGIIYRLTKWARSPVPFRIPTTCGQQKSLEGIKANNLESPYNIWGVLGRMALEIFLFRSLFRNTKAELHDGKLVYGGSKWLWLFGLMFHYTFLIVVIRHLRFFIEPITSLPFLIPLQNIDGLMQIGIPVLYMSGLFLVISVTFLLFRRIGIPQIRYISLASDYFPLLLIFTIGLTGGLMRYLPAARVDVIAVKELAMGLMTFNPVIPEGIGAMFFIHLFLVSVLLIYFPISKLMHMGGVFLSPTRNLANNSRAVRHINPWNYPVKVHTYEEWEDEFRDVIKGAGMPVEKE
ncbi:MAG: sulfate reduction electron transfer complex DsrMKJOP subunit DsrM [Candidatus Zixiibacteriota bacterium]